MAEVVLDKIYKQFPSQSGAKNQAVNVLRGIDLQIRDGEFMVLVGPSGCGKSTLLRILAGLETQTAGSIRVGDRTIHTLPPKDRDIAMVFQSYALYPHLSVAGNIGFGLRRSRPRTPLQHVQDSLHQATRRLPAGLRVPSAREERRLLRELIRNRGNKSKAYRMADRHAKRFFVSAYQAALFNQVLARRLARLDRLLPGDIAIKHSNCMR